VVARSVAWGVARRSLAREKRRRAMTTPTDARRNRGASAFNVKRHQRSSLNETSRNEKRPSHTDAATVMTMAATHFGVNAWSRSDDPR
jgi:hypothetical protein